MNTLFTTPKQQISQVKGWNKRYKLGFSEADFKRVTKEADSLVWSGELVTPVLVPYLSDLPTTVTKLLTIIDGSYDKSYISDYIKEVKLAHGEHVPGLRWEIIDLGANKDVAPNEIKAEGAHIGVLAAACWFPDWVKAMDGGKVPYVNVTGLRCTLPGNEAWRHAPCLSWFRSIRGVELSAYWVGNRDSYWACPVVVRRESSELGSPLPLELTINGLNYRRVE